MKLCAFSSRVLVLSRRKALARSRRRWAFFSSNSKDSSSDSSSISEQPLDNHAVSKHKFSSSFLVNNYTAPALAAAFQDRETTLQRCAKLLQANDLVALQKVLSPFTGVTQKKKGLSTTSTSNAFTEAHLRHIRKRLTRLPRYLGKAAHRRAAVMIPLCHVNGQASILFTVRSDLVNTHKGEVCFPGGMVDAKFDKTIVETCLREMNEEVGIDMASVEVLGILRCDWSEILSLTGVAVTPVVGYIGDVSTLEMNINADEVARCFTVPLTALVNPEHWVLREYASPVFKCSHESSMAGDDRESEHSTMHDHVIWGLTGHILRICLRDVIQFEN